MSAVDETSSSRRTRWRDDTGGDVIRQAMLHDVTRNVEHDKMPAITLVMGERHSQRLNKPKNVLRTCSPKPYRRTRIRKSSIATQFVHSYKSSVNILLSKTIKKDVGSEKRD